MTGVFGGGGVQTVQTQNMVDLTLAGNTSGTLALMSSGTVTIAGGNNITLSQAGNAFTVSAFSQSLQTQSIICDVNIAGNTSGATADISSGTLVLAGGNNITLSQTANSITISCGAGGGAAPTLPIWENSVGSRASAVQGLNDQFFLVELNPVPGNLFPGNMTVSTAFLDVSASNTVSGSAGSMTFRIGVYTLNASTLSILNSASVGYSINSTQTEKGIMWVSFHSSDWSASPAFSQTQYWIGYLGNELGDVGKVNYLGYSRLLTSVRSGTYPVYNTNSSQGHVPFEGVSVSPIANTSPLPASIQLSELAKTGGYYGYVPHLVFMNLSGAF